MQNFAATPEGAELVEAWGRDAARNLAAVGGRMGLMLQFYAREQPESRDGMVRWALVIASESGAAGVGRPVDA